MKRALPLALAVSACSQFTPPTAYSAWQMCLINHGSNVGKAKLSAVSAHAIVDQCKLPLRQAALQFTQRAYGKDFDANKPNVVAEYRSFKSILEERALLALSDEIKPRFMVL